MLLTIPTVLLLAGAVLGFFVAYRQPDQGKRLLGVAILLLVLAALWPLFFKL